MTDGDLAAMDAAIRKEWERAGVHDSGAVLWSERRAFIAGMRRAAEIADNEIGPGCRIAATIRAKADALEGEK